MGLQDGTLVVDGDGHVMEPEDLWTARMDAERWGDWIPHKVAEDEMLRDHLHGRRDRAAAAASCRTRWRKPSA